MGDTYVLKVRGGRDTYVKADGTTGTGGKGALVGEGVAFTVATAQDQTLIHAPIVIDRAATNQGTNARYAPFIGRSQLMPTLTTTDPHARAHEQTADAEAVTLADGSRWVVRRLTPRECERLQGFPDDWTAIPWRGRPAEECPDGPRYKALGNSMAVPCMQWIGERIQRVQDELDANE